MCCEHLICANCAGPVSEGRCNVCRASRERMGHHDNGGLSVSVMAALLLVMMMAVAYVSTVR